MKERLGNYIQEYSVRNKNGEEIPVYSVTNTQGFCKDYFGKEVASKDKTTYKIVPRGCFAYNPSRINVGSVDYQRYEDRVIVSPLYNVFSVSDNLDKQYLYYYLKSDIVLQRIRVVASGSVRDNLKLAMLYEFPINIKSIEEQKEIVHKLDSVKKIIELRKRQLQQLDELVKSRFVELFGDPKHSDKYSTRKLSSCVANKADMVDGPFGSQVNTKVDYIENGEIPVIRTVNVKMMQFSTDDLKFMSREKYETVIRSQVLPGDVIFTKVGTIGNVCIFPNDYQEAVLSTTGSCRIRVDESIVNRVFFAYNLMYLKDKLFEIASTGVQPFLNMNHIKNIDVLNVPLKQQKVFVTFVEQVDKSKFVVQRALENVEHI